MGSDKVEEKWKEKSKKKSEVKDGKKLNIDKWLICLIIESYNPLSQREVQ